MATTPTKTSTDIDSILHEDRKFECPEEFRKHAHIKSLEEYERIYRESVNDPEGFWGDVANDLHWFKKWDQAFSNGMSVGEVVRRRAAKSFLQLPGSPCADLAQE